MGVEMIFRSIVVGDGTAGESWMIKEFGNNGGSSGGGVIGRNFLDFKEAGFALKENLKGSGVIAGDHGIGFLMAELRALVDEIGPVIKC